MVDGELRAANGHALAAFSEQNTMTQTVQPWHARVPGGNRYRTTYSSQHLQDASWWSKRNQVNMIMRPGDETGGVMFSVPENGRHTR
jgi:hypothetical protein